MSFLRKKILILALVLLPLLSWLANASTPEPPAMPRDYVVDLAGVMNDAAKTQVNALLQELERKTTAQMVVLTVQSLDGEDIRSFGIRMAEKWKLGQKGKDNGALLIVALKDRKYTLETGYGLESVLPDSFVGSLGRQYLVPYFRQGDYSTGIAAAVNAVAGTIAEHENVQLSGRQDLRPASRPANKNPLGAAQTIFVVILIFIGLILAITHPRQCFLILLMSNMGGGRGGWSGGGGGFGDGGGGSFGGGGGGGFGGGGASGSW